MRRENPSQPLLRTMNIFVSTITECTVTKTHPVMPDEARLLDNLGTVYVQRWKRSYFLSSGDPWCCHQTVPPPPWLRQLRTELKGFYVCLFFIFYQHNYWYIGLACKPVPTSTGGQVEGSLTQIPVTPTTPITAFCFKTNLHPKCSSMFSCLNIIIQLERLTSSSPVKLTEFPHSHVFLWSEAKGAAVDNLTHTSFWILNLIYTSRKIQFSTPLETVITFLCRCPRKLDVLLRRGKRSLSFQAETSTDVKANRGVTYRAV